MCGTCFQRELANVHFSFSFRKGRKTIIIIIWVPVRGEGGGEVLPSDHSLSEPPSYDCCVIIPYIAYAINSIVSSHHPLASIISLLPSTSMEQTFRTIPRSISQVVKKKRKCSLLREIVGHRDAPPGPQEAPASVYSCITWVRYWPLIFSAMAIPWVTN